MIKKYLKKIDIIYSLVLFFREFKILSKDVMFKNALGFKFKGEVGMENGSFECKELKIFNSVINFSDLFVNAGSNVGYFVCHALNKGLDVIAFEPNHLNHQVLMQNVVANNWQKKTTIYPLALSDEVSINKIYGGGTGASLIKGWANQDKSVIVPINKLDNFKTQIQKYVQPFIFIDIEGNEYNCLIGSQEILNFKKKPIWFIEICFDQHQPNYRKYNPHFLDTFELFNQYGYSCYMISEKIECIDIARIKNIMKTKINDLDSHNFLFIDSKNKTLLKQLFKN